MTNFKRTFWAAVGIYLSFLLAFEAFQDDPAKFIQQTKKQATIKIRTRNIDNEHK